jgi:hypothetical protein
MTDGPKCGYCYVYTGRARSNPEQCASAIAYSRYGASTLFLVCTRREFLVCTRREGHRGQCVACGTRRHDIARWIIKK